MTEPQLLGAAQIRQLAEQLSVTPTKKLGQNFVIDPNTVRRIAQEAHLERDDIVVEIGPGLGSLTLAVLPHVDHVLAVEIDTLLARQLPSTIAKYAPDFVSHVTVINDDAMTISELPREPTRLVANLPYNVSVPVVLHFLERFPSIRECLVMVQAEVADRMAAGPGSRIYGVPSVKLAWYGDVTKAGAVGRNVFWPAPNVNSGLVRIVRGDVPGDDVLRRRTFAIVDSAFGQRRKTLRSSLNQALGSSAVIEEILGRAGIEPGLRGEQLTLEDFVAIARAADGVQ
jgi:16S rRNA (adenine1518-N6/adenine1519-N6)-dimethyltransferase